MTSLFTRDLLNSFKSNLNHNVVSAYNISPIDSYHNCDEYWFQLLILEKDYPNSENFKAKLVYGKKKYLDQEYGTGLILPTNGVEIDADFVSKSDIEYSTVRFLLQCRKLSQLFTYTWLNPNEIEKEMKLKIELTRIILDTYNIIPDSYILSEKVPDLRLKQMLLEIEKKNPQLLDFLIKPESVSYASIPLALLLCGQAYYYEENGELTRICDPILSTYELIWEYAVRLSWDTFYATRIDISQAGLSPKPPYTKVTMGYPPKPNEFSLKEEHIKEWVTAKEHYECGGYPFYPEKDSENWKNKQLDHVVAPYPYIPLSCL